MTALTRRGVTTTAHVERSAVRWLPTFVGFPLGGFVAELIAGPGRRARRRRSPAARSPASILGAVQVVGPGRRPACRRARGSSPPALGLTAGLALGAGGGRLRHRAWTTWSSRARSAASSSAPRRRSCCAAARPPRVLWAPALERAVGARVGDHHRRSASTSRRSTRSSAPAARSVVTAAHRRAPRAAGRTAERTRVTGVAPQRWLALGVLCVSLLAIVVDNTIVNVALPTLVRDLEADVSELQWVVDAYTLVFAGLLLLAGALGDRYGRRRTLLAGLAVFGVASAWAAYAGGVDGLDRRPRRHGGRRRVHHAGDAVARHQHLRRRPRARHGDRHLGRDGRPRRRARPGRRRLPARPLLVGLDLHRQRPADRVVAIVAGRRLVPESRDPVARRIDWTGAALSGVGLVAFVWAIIEAPSQGLDVGARCSPPARSPRPRSARSSSGSAAPPSRCSTSASSATRASPRRAPRSWCCSSRCSGSCSCRRSTCSSSSATRRRPRACACCRTPGR